MNKELPTEAHLYYTTSGGYGYLTLRTNDGLKNSPDYQWLGSAKLDFGNVVFDEKELMLKSLNTELGVAQGKVNEIKDKIQQLLAIGHDIDYVPVEETDDDIPF